MATPDYLGADPDAGGGPSARQRGLDEPNYYEIALTSRQVLVGFVILLACVVVAFFAGVWVGTSGAAARVETAQIDGPADAGSAVRPATARPATARPGAARPGEARAGEARAGEARPARPRAGGQAAGPAAGPGRPAVVAGKPAEDEPPAEEFQFFSENEETPRRQPGGGGPAGRSPHRARGEGPRPQPGGATPAPAAAPTGAGAVASQQADGPRAPEPAAAPPRSAPPQPSPAAASAASTPTSAREASPSRQPTPAPVASGRTVVQVFSSTDDDQARKVQQRLQAAGYAATIASLSKDGTTLHRVRVGPFPSEAEANRVAAEIKSRLRLDTWVTTP